MTVPQWIFRVVGERQVHRHKVAHVDHAQGVVRVHRVAGLHPGRNKARWLLPLADLLRDRRCVVDGRVFVLDDPTPTKQPRPRPAAAPPALRQG